MKPNRDLKTKEGAALGLLILACLLQDGLAEACGLAGELLVPPDELAFALLALTPAKMRKLVGEIAVMADDDILPGPFRAEEMRSFLTRLSENQGMPRNGGLAH